jgi:membrane protein required for colicin V production
MPSWTDIIIAIVLILAIWRGWVNGFIYELAVLCAFFTGLYAAFKFAWFAREKISDWFNVSQHSAAEISFFVMFVVVFIAIILLGKLFSSLVNVTPFGIFNRILGGLFGLMRYTLVLSLALLFMEAFIPNSDLKKSKLAKPISKIAPAVLPVLNKVHKEIMEIPRLTTNHKP